MTCTKCGATLADNAQYCMQCGTPAAAIPPGPTPLAAGIFVGPAVLSGTVMGVLSSIPIVNCLCCAWVLGGGGLGAWLVGRNVESGPRALTYGDGAFAGVLAGVWGAVVTTVLSIPLRMLSSVALGDQQADLEALLSEYPEIAEPLREILMNLASGDLSPLIVLFTLISNLVIYGLFAMIGGILLVAVFRRPGTTHTPSPPPESN